MVAAVVGDIHSYLLPPITYSQLTFYPMHRYQVNRLARFTPFHYYTNICFVYSGVDHSCEVERPFDSRMPSLLVNAQDLLRIQAISAMSLNFDPKLTPLFDGKDSDLSVQEWIEKAGLICQFSGVKCIECVVPMYLSGGAYAVYQQLSEDKRRDFVCTKSALYTAIALDSVSAWKDFMACKLRLEETVDVYLAELRRLSVLFGGMSEKGLMCAFIAGTPKSVEELLWTSSEVDNMDILEVLARARSILKTGPMTMEQAAAAQPSQCQTKETDAPKICCKCDGPNHLARDYLFRHKPIQKAGTTPKIPVLCYKCKTKDI